MQRFTGTVDRAAHGNAQRGRGNGHPKAVRAVRLAPLAGALIWLAAVALTVAGVISACPLDQILFACFLSTVAIAVASGVYERPRLSAHELALRRIDWDAFDRARSDW
jgi:hypothetical protein